MALNSISLSCKTYEEVLAKYEKHESSVAYRKWSQLMVDYFAACGLIGNEHEARRIAIFKYQGGDMLAKYLPDPMPNTLALLMTYLATVILPPTQTLYHAYKFGSLKRKQDQTFSSNATELRQLASVASFPVLNVESEIMAVFLRNCNHDELRSYMLTTVNVKLTLTLAHGLILV